MADQTVVTAGEEPALASRLFTAWYTSLTDRADHAVTDEEFAARRSEPVALCGVAVGCTPMEWASGPRCPRCAAELAAAETGTILPRLQAGTPASLWVHVFRLFEWIPHRRRAVSTSTGSRSQTSSPTGSSDSGDRPKPPAEDQAQASAGATAGTETTLNTPVSVPALDLSATVTTPSGRHAAQPSTPTGGPGAAGTGLGGPHTAEDPHPRHVPLTERRSAAGAGQRHTPLPAAALSAATPEGRDRLDEATPHRAPARRLVQIHPTPTTAQLTPR